MVHIYFQLHENNFVSKFKFDLIWVGLSVIQFRRYNPVISKFRKYYTPLVYYHSRVTLNNTGPDQSYFDKITQIHNSNQLKPDFVYLKIRSKLKFPRSYSARTSYVRPNFRTTFHTLKLGHFDCTRCFRVHERLYFAPIVQNQVHKCRLTQISSRKVHPKHWSTKRE